MGPPPGPPPFDLQDYIDTCEGLSSVSSKSFSSFDRRRDALDACEESCIYTACKMMEELIEALDKMEEDFNKYEDREIEYENRNGDDVERDCTRFVPFFNEGPPDKGGARRNRALRAAQLDEEGEELVEYLDKLAEAHANGFIDDGSRNLESFSDQRELSSISSISLDSSDLLGDFGAFRDRTLGGLWNTLDCEFTPPP